MLKGNNDIEKIWNFLSQHFTYQGVAGLMGNLKAESGLKSNNLQNSVNTRLNVTDEQYTDLVDKMIYTGFSIDSAGYGLAQWTSSGRKQNLYNYALSKKVSIGNLEMQLEFLIQEMKTSYKKVYQFLTMTNNIKEASDYVLTKYEKPKNQSSSVKDKRYTYSLEIYNKFVSVSSSLKPGDKVKVINNVTYDGKKFKLYYSQYDLISIKNDRAVIGIDTTVTAAINVSNIELIKK